MTEFQHNASQVSSAAELLDNSETDYFSSRRHHHEGLYPRSASADPHLELPFANIYRELPSPIQLSPLPSPDWTREMSPTHHLSGGSPAQSPRADTSPRARPA